MYFFFTNLFFKASRDLLCDCYCGRCQRIAEQSAYMVGITRNLGKQQRLIFPVVIEGNASRVFVFFRLRQKKTKHGLGGAFQLHNWKTPHWRPQWTQKDFLDWHWPFSGLVIRRTRPLAVFPSALIYRFLDFFKIIFPIVQFAELCAGLLWLMTSRANKAHSALLSQNKCLPSKLADWRMILADQMFPHVKECLRVQPRGKVACQKRCDHPQGAVWAVSPRKGVDRLKQRRTSNKA